MLLRSSVSAARRAYRQCDIIYWATIVTTGERDRNVFVVRIVCILASEVCV